MICFMSDHLAFFPLHTCSTMPLFGSSKKNPAEVVKMAGDALAVLDNESASGKKTEKVSLFKVMQ